ncbi:MAG: helix-turn-helix transcriptional regulator, partial [Clostridia bacterium]|nr:helix-turn-helix transcriptional regulator [Clostridia bacterium]
VSNNRLYECFHLCFNQTINGYITGKRIEKSVSLLMDEKLSIEEVAKESGFSDVSYFYKVFKKETGQTPKSYRLTYLKQAE